MKNLTETEKRILIGLQKFEEEFKRKPSYKELGAYIKPPITKSTISNHVARLVLKGKLKIEEGVSKSIQIV